MDSAFSVNPPHPKTYNGVEVDVAGVDHHEDGIYIAHLTSMDRDGVGWSVSLTEDELALVAQ
jgi:hypothetical protein